MMESLLQSIIKFDTPISAFIALLIILAICYLFYSRSGSTYSLYYRLWSILVGEKSFHHPTLETYMQERKDLDKYNAIFNTEIKTTSDLLSFQEWVNHYDIEIKKISESKGYFDFKRLKLLKPYYSVTFISFILSVFLFLFGMAIGVLGVIDKAMVSFKDDESWVFINHNVAKPFSKKYSITPETCTFENYQPEKISRLTGLSFNTIQVICNIFNNKEDLKAIDRIIAEQQKLPFFIIFPLLLSLKFLILTTRRLCARDHRRHIKSKIEAKRSARKI